MTPRERRLIYGVHYGSKFISTRKNPFYPSSAIVYAIPPYCFDIL
jgi:hypothetical protein